MKACDIVTVGSVCSRYHTMASD